MDNRAIYDWLLDQARRIERDAGVEQWQMITIPVQVRDALAQETERFRTPKTKRNGRQWCEDRLWSSATEQEKSGLGPQTPKHSNFCMREFNYPCFARYHDNRYHKLTVIVICLEHLEHLSQHGFDPSLKSIFVTRDAVQSHFGTMMHAASIHLRAVEIDLDKSKARVIQRKTETESRKSKVSSTSLHPLSEPGQDNQLASDRWSPPRDLPQQLVRRNHTRRRMVNPNHLCPTRTLVSHRAGPIPPFKRRASSPPEPEISRISARLSRHKQDIGSLAGSLRTNESSTVIDDPQRLQLNTSLADVINNEPDTPISHFRLDGTHNNDSSETFLGPSSHPGKQAEFAEPGTAEPSFRRLMDSYPRRQLTGSAPRDWPSVVRSSRIMPDPAQQSSASYRIASFHNRSSWSSRQPSSLTTITTSQLAPNQSLHVGRKETDPCSASGHVQGEQRSEAINFRRHLQSLFRTSAMPLSIFSRGVGMERASLAESTLDTSLQNNLSTTDVPGASDDAEYNQIWNSCIALPDSSSAETSPRCHLVGSASVPADNEESSLDPASIHPESHGPYETPTDIPKYDEPSEYKESEGHLYD